EPFGEKTQYGLLVIRNQERQEAKAAREQEADRLGRGRFHSESAWKRKSPRERAFFGLRAWLESFADEVRTHPGFHVGRGRVLGRGRRNGAGLQLRADLAGRRVAVVRLRVYRNRHLVRYVRAAHDQAGESQAGG